MGVWNPSSWNPGDDVDSQNLQNSDVYDHQLRIRAKGLLRDHNIPANVLGIPPEKGGNQVWRCVPMDQIDLEGEEAAKQSGAAMYWVMTANGEPAHSEEHLLQIENGPIEQPQGGVTMMCHEGKQKHWNVPIIAPGLFALEKRAA